jgi:hypothetical protein
VIDHYAVLGVARTATKAEVKAAYRAKARELHPDVNPNPAAVEQFKEMSRAYDVLHDDVTRAQYDRSIPDEPPASRGNRSAAGQSATNQSATNMAEETAFVFVCNKVVQAMSLEEARQRGRSPIRSAVFGVAKDILDKSVHDYEAALRRPEGPAHRPVVLAVAERFVQTVNPSDDIADAPASTHLIDGVLGMVGLSRVAQVVGRDATPRAKEAAARAVMFALAGALADAGLISLISPTAAGRYKASANEAYAELEAATTAAV